MESTPASADSAVEPAAIRPALPALPRLEARRRALIANTMLGGMVVAAFLMAAGAAAKRFGPTLHIHHPLPDSLRGPLHLLDLSLSGTEFGIVFIALGVCYLGVLAFADSIRVRVGIGAIVLLHLLFVIAPPLLSSDIFNYVGYARLDAVHGLNPYVHPLSAAPTDPSYIYVGWPLNTTAYGPLFTVASLPLGWMGFTTALWLLKSVTALASLGCVALVWACARRLGRPPLPATLFFGLNPVLLAYAVGGAHNDLLMLAAALGGIYLLLGGRESGMAALVGAVAVKSSSVVLLPFALLGSKRPVRALIWGVVAAAVVAAITVIAFGTHVSSLLHVLQRDARLDTPNDVPGVINSVLGLGLTNHALGRIGMLVMVTVIAVLLIRVYRGGDWLENAGWATCAVIVTTTWFLPWYLVWFLPLAALALRPYQRLTALALTALAIGLQLPLIFGK
ncbi:MAG TPA: glycosyltransferase family 87 protein [Solirubrobacterales bacterium]|jgi:alpha-1,6-mannosyltransferase